MSTHRYRKYSNTLILLILQVFETNNRFSIKTKSSLLMGCLVDDFRLYFVPSS